MQNVMKRSKRCLLIKEPSLNNTTNQDTTETEQNTSQNGEQHRAETLDGDRQEQTEHTKRDDKFFSTFHYM